MGLKDFKNQDNIQQIAKKLKLGRRRFLKRLAIGITTAGLTILAKKTEACSCPICNNFCNTCNSNYPVDCGSCNVTDYICTGMDSCNSNLCSVDVCETKDACNTDQCSVDHTCQISDICYVDDKCWVHHTCSGYHKDCCIGDI